MTANDAIINLVNYLEMAQSRGTYTLREAREIANTIDFLAQPLPEAKKSQNSGEPDLKVD